MLDNAFSTEDECSSRTAAVCRLDCCPRAQAIKSTVGWQREGRDGVYAVFP